LVVAEFDKKIIGSGYARIEDAKPYQSHKKYAYLGFMFVLPEFRGKGINKMILESLKSWSRSQNINEIRLEVYNDNVSAIRAYEKAGFSKYIIEMRLPIE
jgi:GNAT superfamily N-acetyltransferase